MARSAERAERRWRGARSARSDDGAERGARVGGERGARRGGGCYRGRGCCRRHACPGFGCCSCRGRESSLSCCRGGDGGGGGEGGEGICTFSTERACAERGARRGARCAQTEKRSVLRCAQTTERGAQRAERRQRSGATMPQGQVAPRYYTHFDSFTPTHSPYLGPVQSTPYYNSQPGSQQGLAERAFNE